MSSNNCIYYEKVLPLVGPNVTNGRNLLSLSRRSLQFATNLSFHKPRQLNVGPRLVYNSPNHKIFSPIHAFGGEGKSENELYLWESLKKAMGGFRKEPSVGDFLREVRERGLHGNGGGRNSPRGGGGDDDSSDPEYGLAGTFDEIQQVIMAALGVVFLYIFMIHGEEMWRLVRDYIKYLFGGRASVRLRRTMDRWLDFYEIIAWKAGVRKDWLDQGIVFTEAWWHKLQQLAHLMRSYYSSFRSQDA